jgi:predicted glutamine amidotransferase
VQQDKEEILMCIIAVTEHPNLLSREIFENCWDNNNQGAGFAYVANKQIKVIKELTSFKRFWRLFQKHREIAIEEESPMLIHFRIASHGSVSINNIHPFFVNKNLVMAHNGILPIKEDGKKSDTRTFCDQVLKQLPSGFEKVNAYTFLIEGWMGKGSKIAFLNTKKEVVFLNESAWENEPKLKTKFSNRSFSYKFSRAVTTPTYKGPTIYSGESHGANRSFPFATETKGQTGKVGGTGSEIAKIDKEGVVEKAVNKLIKETLVDSCHMCSVKINIKEDPIFRVLLSGESNRTMLCKDCLDHLQSQNVDVDIVDIEVGITEEVEAL